MKSLVILAFFPIFSFAQGNTCVLNAGTSPFQQLKAQFDAASPISLSQFPKPTEPGFSRWHGNMVNENKKLSEVFVFASVPIDRQFLVQKADGRWEIVDRVFLVYSDQPWAQTTPPEATEQEIGQMIETPDLTEMLSGDFPTTITFRTSDGVILYHETGTRTPEYYGCYWKE